LLTSGSNTTLETFKGDAPQLKKETCAVDEHEGVSRIWLPENKKNQVTALLTMPMLHAATVSHSASSLDSHRATTAASHPLSGGKDLLCSSLSSHKPPARSTSHAGQILHE
jgi:hypothetical protein